MYLIETTFADIFPATQPEALTEDMDKAIMLATNLKQSDPGRMIYLTEFDKDADGLATPTGKVNPATGQTISGNPSQQLIDAVSALNE